MISLYELAEICNKSYHTETFRSDETDTEFLVKYYNQSAIYCFRGTESLTDIKMDINIDKVKIEDGEVHEGFYQAFESIKDILDGLFHSVKFENI